MSSPQLSKAVLIPMNGEQPDSDESQYIVVQFNPDSIKVTLSNTLKADSSGGDKTAAAQYVDKSESSLSIQLIFDTTVARNSKADFSFQDGSQHSATSSQEANSDVRKQTKAIADKFMKPQSSDSDSEHPAAPLRCRFQWGAFVFVGMLSSYNETLDYFSPEGIPLRATLALSFKEDRYQFESIDVKADARKTPTFSPGGSNVSASDAARDSGKKPKAWREIALFNGLENPRLSSSLGLNIPKQNMNKNQMGFNSGRSSSLGTGIPGAFLPSGSTKQYRNKV